MTDPLGIPEPFFSTTDSIQRLCGNCDGFGFTLETTETPPRSFERVACTTCDEGKLL